MSPSSAAPGGGPTETRLIGDIGGTNARFAIAERGSYSQEDQEVVANNPTLAEAAEAYLGRRSLPARPAAAVLAVAGYITEDRAELTNVGWSFSLPALQARLGLISLRVVNDLEAVAMALPYLGPSDMLGVGRPVEAQPHGAKVVVGPGTGLGIAGLVSTPNGWMTVPGEGGHASMPADDDLESAVIDNVRRRYAGHASIERFLSGPGLVNLYEALCSLQGKQHERLSARQITTHALAGADACCNQALDLFCAMLGGVAGNIALTFGAKGGVYLAGGILPRLGDYFVGSRFRQRFEEKGRLAAYVREIPTFLITHPYPALLGLANAPAPVSAMS